MVGNRDACWVGSRIRQTKYRIPLVGEEEAGHKRGNVEMCERMQAADKASIAVVLDEKLRSCTERGVL